jgi:hypothetical protein
MELIKDQDALQSIVKQAWKDATFKNDLLQNPVKTIEGFLGKSVTLPQGKKIAFVDQSDPSTIFVTIPVELNMDDMELDEEQLEIVAGGDGKIPIVVGNA